MHTHGVYDEWIDFAKKHFTVRSRRGDITGFAFYYDPIERFAYCPPPGLAGYGMLAPLLYLYPQAPAFGQALYEAGVRDLGWDGRTQNILQAFDDPRWLILTLLLARELGDETTACRLQAVAEREFGPDFFEDDDDRFAWSFGQREAHPRGQLNSLLMLGEIGEAGAWTNVFRGPRDAQFDMPTVEGIDYPNLGICRARNDVDRGQLDVTTYAATAAMRGKETSFTITGLPAAESVEVYREGERYPRWHAMAPDSIQIGAPIGDQSFRIVWGRATDGMPRSRTSIARDTSAEVSTSVRAYPMAAPPRCDC